MTVPPIIIAGGGIAGLASALALGRHDALVLEQSSSLSEIGAGLQLGPNAVRALQKLGAWEAVEPFTTNPPEIHLWDGVSGKCIKRLPLGVAFEARYGAPYRAAHRADLHAALLQIVQTRPNIQMRLNEKISSVAVHINDVAIETSGHSWSTQALIAADGVKSTIRQNLIPGSIARDSGVVHHRALIALPRIANVAMECVNVWMYPQGHVVHYPVGREQRLNIVALTPQAVRPLVYFKDAATILKKILALSDRSFTPWPGLYAPPLSSWTKGGAMLIGDAAHGTLPYLAQGAAMALEDAACLSTVLPTTRILRHAFAETAQRRMARTTKLHQETLRAGKIYHMSRMTAHVRNAVLSAAPRQLIAMRLDWLYHG